MTLNEFKRMAQERPIFLELLWRNGETSGIGPPCGPSRPWPPVRPPWPGGTRRCRRRGYRHPASGQYDLCEPFENEKGWTWLDTVTANVNPPL